MSETNTEIQLPDIDQLIKMATDDPQGLEKIRTELCTRLIQNAPQQCQKRLHGLQFQIDMERRRSKNPIHSCIKLSRMMLDSYQDMRDVITNIDSKKYNFNNEAFEGHSKQISCKQTNSTNILAFKLAREN